MEISEEFQSAYDLINYTKRHVFLTGKAGTGKTTFLTYLVEHSHKKIVVAAPTGVAAIQANGVTLHSLFLLPFTAYISTFQAVDRNLAVNKNDLIRGLKMSQTKRDVLLEMELLIIDEISMVRCDMLDAIDEILRFVRRNRNPFGGVQLLLIGDLYQLPPVVKQDEWTLLQEYYASPFFFDAQSLRESTIIGLELTQIYRQTNSDFISILNHLRVGKLSENDIATLNKRLQPNFEPKEEGWITLSTHNDTVHRINKQNLDLLHEKSHHFQAEIYDTFPEHMFPVDRELVLKVGAQVMFIKNDSSPEKKYFNGKLAKIISIEKDEITVTFLQDTTQEHFVLQQETWNHKEYIVDAETGEIEENILGSFSHFPIKLAWAITIHKSQGLTFNKAIIDINRAFVSGQAYVALSRCTSLEGMVLVSALQKNQLQVHERIIAFHDTFLGIEESNSIVEHEKYNNAIEHIIEILQFNDIEKAIQIWIVELNKRKIPQKEEIQLLYKNIVHSFAEIQDVVTKFQLFIEKNKPFGAENFRIIEEKSSNALSYFIPIIEEKILVPFLLHQKNFEKKEKIRLYKKQLIVVQQLMLKSRESLYQTTLLGKSICAIPKTEIHIHSVDSQKEQAEKVKLSSIEKTLELLQEGNTLEQIADIRALKISTIQEQFYKLFSEGKWNSYESFVESKTIQQLLVYFAKNGTSQSISEVKKNCNDMFSYFEIKVALVVYKIQKHDSNS